MLFSLSVTQKEITGDSDSFLLLDNVKKIQIIRFSFCRIYIQICASAERKEEFVQNTPLLP